MEISNSFLEKLVSAMPGNVYWKNRHGIYLGCNEGNAKTLGIKREDIVGKNAYALMEKKHADAVSEIDEKVMGQNKGYSLEEEGINANGEFAIYLTQKIPLHDEKGQVIGLLGVSFDITERKKIEKDLELAREKLEYSNKIKSEFINKMAHLEQIIASMPGNVYWKDRKGKYLGCNANMAKILKLNSTSDIIGKTIYELTEKNNADFVAHEDEAIMASNISKSLEEEGLDINGKPATYLTSKIPLCNEKNEVIGLLGISFDITERKNLEEVMKEAKETAEAANAAKTEFIQNMEHDIRTPFSGIWSLANVLAEREDNSSKKECLQEIAKAGKELLDYCNAILDFTKIESGTLPIFAKEFNLLSTLEKVITIEKPILKHKRLEHKINYDDKIPHFIIGDEYRLSRMLINIVSNAIKFTEKGHVYLNTELISRNDKDIIIKFTVNDSGAGIPKDKQNFIFEKFSKVTPSNRGYYKGLGLGLSAVKYFVDELGGKIEIESNLNKGTNFSLILPFKLPLA